MWAVAGLFARCSWRRPQTHAAQARLDSPAGQTARAPPTNRSGKGQRAGGGTGGATPTSALTVHLALVGQDDLAPAARRVDGQGLLKALLDVRAPHSLGIVVQPLVQAFGPIFPGLPGAAVGGPAVGRYCAGCSGLWA